MRPVAFDTSWPESWKASYAYDQQEVYGQQLRTGYAYAYANRAREALHLVVKAAPPGASVLDAAAGQGNFSLRLAERGYRVTWNDLRAELAGYVALKHEFGYLEYLPGNILDLAGDRQWDVVLVAEVIEHVAHPDRFLAHVARLVRPGGHVVFTTPNGEYLRNNLPRFSDCPDPGAFEQAQYRPDADGHIFLLHREEVEELAAAAGLALRELRYFTNPITRGHLKTEALLRRLPARVVWRCENMGRSLPQAIVRRLHTGMAGLLHKEAALSSSAG